MGKWFKRSAWLAGAFVGLAVALYAAAWTRTESALSRHYEIADAPLRFTGVDTEIDLAPPGHKQEFDQWRWAHMDELMDLIVPFKRQVYAQVLAEFRHLGA